MSVAAAALAALLLAPGEPSLLDRQATELDEEVIQELEGVAPDAVPEARRAGDAFRAGRWEEAYRRYVEVLAAAPRFPHALRRMCRARSELGDHRGAELWCREAVAASASPSNRVALAHVLTEPGAYPNVAERNEAAGLVKDALASDRRDVATAVSACEVALRVEDSRLLGGCSDRLARLVPGHLAAEYFGFHAAMVREEYRAARRHLAAARAAGLDPEVADRLGVVLDESQPAWSRWGPLVAAVLAACAAALLGLRWAIQSRREPAPPVPAHPTRP